VYTGCIQSIPLDFRTCNLFLVPCKPAFNCISASQNSNNQREGRLDNGSIGPKAQQENAKRGVHGELGQISHAIK